MVVDEANVAEGKRIDGHPVTVIHGDTGADAEGFAAQAARLIAVSHAEALIGASTVVQLEKAAPVAQTNQVALFTPSGGLAGVENKSVFAVGLDPRERGRRLAQFAAEDRKITDVLIIMDITHDLYSTMASAFEAEFKHPDRMVRQKWSFRESKDLPDLAARIVKNKPPALVFCGAARNLLELRRSGVPIEIPVFFIGEEEEPIFRRDAEHGRNVYFTTAFTVEDPSPRVQEFVNKFRTRANEPADAEAALSYDATDLLLTIARRAKRLKLDKEFRAQVTPQTDFECLTGPFWFTAEQTARRTVYVLHTDSGTAKLAATYLPRKP